MTSVLAPRRILVVGVGGREHALAWRLRRDPGVERVIVAPGNPGMTDVAEVAADVRPDADEVTALCEREGIDLVVIGPEAPLVDGLADGLRARGIRVFGPGAAAGRTGRRASGTAGRPTRPRARAAGPARMRPRAQSAPRGRRARGRGGRRAVRARTRATARARAAVSPATRREQLRRRPGRRRPRAATAGRTAAARSPRAGRPPRVRRGGARAARAGRGRRPG